MDVEGRGRAVMLTSLLHNGSHGHSEKVHELIYIECGLQGHLTLSEANNGSNYTVPFFIPAQGAFFDSSLFEGCELLGTVAGQEPLKEHVKLSCSLKAATIDALLDELAEALKLGVGDHRETGTEHVDNFHGQIDARGRLVEGDAEVSGRQELSVVAVRQPSSDDLNARKLSAVGELLNPLQVHWSLRTLARNNGENGRGGLALVIYLSRASVGDKSAEEDAKVLVGSPGGTADNQSDIAVENILCLGLCLWDAHEDLLSLFARRNGLENGGWSVVQGVDGLAEIEFAGLQLLGHGIGNGQIDVAEATSEEELVPAVERHKRRIEFAFLSEDGVAVVVPVNDDLASTDPSDKQSHMESRNRGRVLLWLETIASRSKVRLTWMIIHSAAGAVYIIVAYRVQNW